MKNSELQLESGLPYRVGYCSQCEAEVMIKGTNGRIQTIKPKYEQTYLVIPGFARVKVVVCKTCMKNLDAQKIMSRLVAPGSQAFKDDRLRQQILDKPVPYAEGNRNLNTIEG